jgi:hypothetical protein
MSHVRGMIVSLLTSSSGGAGTDDHIYIGVVGTRGGREFPLDVHRFDDFEKGSSVKYWFGEVWDGTELAGAKNPYRSAAGDRNDPEWFRIELDEVESVYIRKQGDRTGDDDDAYKLNQVQVKLYGGSPEVRTFGTSNDLWFGNEYGHQAWLEERR